MDLRHAWDATVAKLSAGDELSQSGIAFLNMCRFAGEYNDLVMLSVPNEYTRSHIEDKCLPFIVATMSSFAGQNVNIGFLIDSSSEDAAVEQPSSTTDEKSAESEPPSHSSASAPQTDDAHPTAIPLARPSDDTDSSGDQAQQTPQSSDESSPSDNSQHSAPAAVENAKPIAVDFQANYDGQTNLNYKYTFDTFIIGSSNRFATAAAKAVAETPAINYNPLFIYGGSGLGKTHLLHAIGIYAKSLYPEIKVKYINSEEFANDLINCLREHTTAEFQKRYRNIDILLIDDIQFFQGKEQTVVEFFHTFNALHNAGKQIVITSDVSPKNLGGFEERLRSRFEWGLLTDVQPPDLETRIAILRKRADLDNLDVPNDILNFIASRFISNIRELEGALLRVTAFASLNNQPITMDLAEMVLKDIMSDPQDHEITASLIKAQTANYFNITVKQLTSTDRSKSISEARQIAMHLCRELTDLSLPRIGSEFGGRDHTTVMHATRKIQDRMRNEPPIFTHVSELTNHIRQVARNPKPNF